MAIINFFWRHGRLDEGFCRTEERDDDEVEVDLLDKDDETAVEEDAIGDEDIPWQRLPGPIFAWEN